MKPTKVKNSLADKIFLIINYLDFAFDPLSHGGEHKRRQHFIKKLVTLILALCLVLTCAGTAFAEAPKGNYTSFEETVVLTAAKNDGFTFYGEDDQWVSPRRIPG